MVSAAALAGAAAFGSLSAVAADEKPKSELDEKAERQRVIACGMTEARLIAGWQQPKLPESSLSFPSSTRWTITRWRTPFTSFNTSC
jgi:hypothetical protein